MTDTGRFARRRVKSGGVWLAAVVLLCSGFVFAAHGDSSLSGEWSVTATIEPGPFSLDLSTSLDLTYAIGEWSFSAETSFSTAAWKSQSFEASGTLGAIELESSLGFSPSSVKFKRWSNDVDLDLDPISLSASFDVAPNYISLDLSGSGEVDDVSVDVDLEFRSRGGCDLLFDELEVTVDFPLFCEYGGSAAVAVEDDGFDELSFSVDDVELCGMPALTYDIDLIFELDAKTVKLRPSFDFGDPVCVDLYIEVQTPTQTTFSSLDIYGIKFQAEFGAVEFEAISYLDGTHKLKGKYWEMYRLAINEDGCCGEASADLRVYFLEGGIGLFDLGLFEGAFSLDLGESIVIETGLTWDIEASALDELTLSVDVSW